MSSRRDIYYWKCDRAAAHHGSGQLPSERDSSRVIHTLQYVLCECWPNAAIELRPAGGQGNHLTFIADVETETYFVRVEDGPEHDDYFEVESALLMRLHAAGVPVPRVHFSDATRGRAPFAFQILELIKEPDLNHHYKAGNLDALNIARQIGSSIAHYQQLIEVSGFGPFDVDTLRHRDEFSGLYHSAVDYYGLKLQAHLEFLVQRNFLSQIESYGILATTDKHLSVLLAGSPVLVHKDMALWNVMGTPQNITAFIDWDDSVGGDAMDDLSLLACFHTPDFVRAAVDGYAHKCELPPDHMIRFWLHLLRNMIVKAVIRIGAGYFERTDSFFLLGPGLDGASFRELTRTRLLDAAQALREKGSEFHYV